MSAPAPEPDWDNLVTLDFSGPRIGLDAAQAEALCAPVLVEGRVDFERLVLSTRAFSREAAAVVASIIPRLPRLCSLIFSDIIAGRKEEEALAVYRTLAGAFEGGRQVLEVDLSSNAMGQKGLVACGRILEGQAGLQRLMLRSNGISAETAQDLAWLLLRGPPTALRTLHTMDNMAGASGAIALADIVARSPHLRDFMFASSRGGPAGGVALARALAHTPALQRLCLRDNMLQAGTCAALAASLPGLPALRHLDLGDIQMGGPGLAALAEGLRAAPAAPHLTHLDVSCNDLQARDAAVLGALLPHLPALATLRAQENEFGSSGAVALGVGLLRRAAGAGGAAPLQELDLRSCRLGSAGAVAVVRAALAGVVGGASARRVDVSGNRVSQVGLARALAAVAAAGLPEAALVCGAGDEDEDEEETEEEGEGEGGAAQEQDLLLTVHTPVAAAERKAAVAPPRPSTVTSEDWDKARQAVQQGVLVL